MKLLKIAYNFNESLVWKSQVLKLVQNFLSFWSNFGINKIINNMYVMPQYEAIVHGREKYWLAYLTCQLSTALWLERYDL